MAQLLPITKAKQRLLELARRNQELGESFIILKDGEPVSALLPFGTLPIGALLADEKKKG